MKVSPGKGIGFFNFICSLEHVVLKNIIMTQLILAYFPDKLWLSSHLLNYQETKVQQKETMTCFKHFYAISF